MPARKVFPVKSDAAVLPCDEVQGGRIRRRKQFRGAGRLRAGLVQLHRRCDRLEERLQFRPELCPARGVFYLLGPVDRERVPVGLRRRVAGVEVADVPVELGEGADVLDLLLGRGLGEAEHPTVGVGEGGDPQEKNEPRNSPTKPSFCAGRGHANERSCYDGKTALCKSA